VRRRDFQDRVYDDGFWFTIFHPFVCPVCDGSGGDYGGGYDPDYPCLFCKERGHVGLWAKILSLNGWFLEDTISNVKYTREQRRQKEKHDRLPAKDN
jgi:hypothetical protein